MTCGGCLRAVTHALRTVDPQARIEGDLETRTLKVASNRPEASLLAALSSDSYPAQPLLRQDT
jgi:copper chaperone